MALSQARHRLFGLSGLFPHVFEMVLRHCMREPLFGGYGYMGDASLISAKAKRQKDIEGEKGSWPACSMITLRH